MRGMSVLIRFTINDADTRGPTYDEIAKALADYGRGDGTERPEFTVWGNPSFPKSTVIEYLRADDFATALDRVKRAATAVGVDRYCTDGDFRIKSAY
jgi:hypothetical protein